MGNFVKMLKMHLKLILIALSPMQLHILTIISTTLVVEIIQRNYTFYYQLISLFVKVNTVVNKDYVNIII